MYTPPNLERSLDRLYANRFSEAERVAKARLWRTLCDSFFQHYVPAGSTVLDVGAGYCDFINQIKADRRIAIDLNPDTPRYAGEGVEVYLHRLEDLGKVLETGSIDLAFASNVFEHLRGPDALLEVLTAILQALRPGGRLLIMQPNVGVLGGGFWDFFDHTLPLTERGMEEALRVSGYEILERRARFLPYTTKGRLPQWNWLVRTYLALPPAQWLLGKQMLLLARKPA
jgi:SAM-dependent methyltransferase